MKRTTPRSCGQRDCSITTNPDPHPVVAQQHLQTEIAETIGTWYRRGTLSKSYLRRESMPATGIFQVRAALTSPLKDLKRGGESEVARGLTLRAGREGFSRALGKGWEQGSRGLWAENFARRTCWLVTRAAPGVLNQGGACRCKGRRCCQRRLWPPGWPPAAPFAADGP